MRYLIVIGLMALAGCAGGDVRLSSGLGEHQNVTHTEQQRLEVRADVTDHLYSYTRAERNMNPSDNVPDDLVLHGAGVRLEGFGAEAAVNDDYFLWTVRYDHHAPWGEAFGGFTHLDKWQGKNSKNTAFIGGGYALTDRVILGGWYEVGNVEQRYVDDLYGAYLRVRW